MNHWLVFTSYSIEIRRAVRLYFIITFLLLMMFSPRLGALSRLPLKS